MSEDYPTHQERLEKARAAEGFTTVPHEIRALLAKTLHEKGTRGKLDSYEWEIIKLESRLEMRRLIIGDKRVSGTYIVRHLESNRYFRVSVTHLAGELVDEDDDTLASFEVQPKTTITYENVKNP